MRNIFFTGFIFLSVFFRIGSVEIPQEYQRFLLPQNSPLKKPLDKIFANPHVLDNKFELAKAGFVQICKRSSDMIVASHKKLPGYLLKIYLTHDVGPQIWSWMFNRCTGAENIRNLIAEKKLKHFTVPDKWIYILPGNLDETKQQVAVLVVTDMNIVSDTESEIAWETKITRNHLKELYCILSHGFASCYLPYNIPYTKEGTFACLDTAYPWRVHKYKYVLRYLSDEMCEYWKKLVEKNGGVAS